MDEQALMGFVHKAVADVGSLLAGSMVADVGCGHGASTVHMAKTYLNSTFTGFDPHANSIETARKRAADAGVLERVKFECASAKNITGSYDLITFFHCLHDLGDPVGALSSARSHLQDDGTILLVEPMAGDVVDDNLNPVGAAYYGLSRCYAPPTPWQRTRDGTGRAGRPGSAARCRQPGRVVQVPSGGRGAFQRHLRGADSTSH